MTDVGTTPKNLKRGTVAMLGLPFDDGATFMRGPALAPTRIREVLHSGSANLCAENGMDLENEPRWRDAGDLALAPGTRALAQIEAAVEGIVAAGGRVLSLGGDHSVTYPILRAYARTFPDLSILHLDAHPDLYERYDGNRFANACPFARIMEEGLAARLLQGGIRTMNPHQRSQARRFGVTVIEMREWSLEKIVDLPGPIYLSLDMDVLDPAFAPGVSHHEPGGMTTREVLEIIQHLNAPLIGADIVEFNPRRDPTGITSMAAAKFVKEIVARMLVD